MTHAGTTAIFGAGLMGEALLAGLLASGQSASDIVIVEKSQERAQHIRDKHGVESVSADQAAQQASTLFIVVKPQYVVDVLTEIADSVREDALVISLATGVTIETLESYLPSGAAVARVMPNTPSLVGEGMSAISPGTNCSVDDVQRAEDLMGALGKVVSVDEGLQNAVTAVSGSGPAYVFYVAEAMIEAGVQLGLPRATANELTIQTLVGSAAMLQQTGEHPSVLREQVTSPGGTTAAALRELDSHGVRAAFSTAMRAARDRSVELAGD